MYKSKCSDCDMVISDLTKFYAHEGKIICDSCMHGLHYFKHDSLFALKRRIAELEKTNEILRQQLEESQGSFW